MNAGNPRDDFIADALLDEMERTAWAAQRDDELGLVRHTVTTAEMLARFALDRAAVEAAWPDSHEWRRLQFEAVAEHAAVVQTFGEDAA